jgi:hypothetical protein
LKSWTCTGSPDAQTDLFSDNVGCGYGSQRVFNLTPDKIEQPLTPVQADIIRSGKGILVVLASQVTEAERSQMVAVN